MAASSIGFDFEGPGRQELSGSVPENVGSPLVRPAAETSFADVSGESFLGDNFHTALSDIGQQREEMGGQFSQDEGFWRKFGRSTLETAALIGAARKGDVNTIVNFFQDNLAQKQQEIQFVNAALSFGAKEMMRIQSLPGDEQNTAVKDLFKTVKERLGDEAADSLWDWVSSPMALESLAESGPMQILQEDPKSEDAKRIRAAIEDPRVGAYEDFEKTELKQIMQRRGDERRGVAAVSKASRLAKAIRADAENPESPNHQRAVGILEYDIRPDELLEYQENAVRPDGSAIVEESSRVTVGDIDYLLRNPDKAKGAGLGGMTLESSVIDAEAGALKLRKELQVKKEFEDPSSIVLLTPPGGGEPISRRLDDPEVDDLLAAGYNLGPSRTVTAEATPEQVGIKLPTPTKRKLADKIVERQESLGRLREIRRSLDPQLLKQYNQWLASGIGIAVRNLPESLLEQSEFVQNNREFVKGFREFETLVGQNRDLYIKLITGAQMSEPEAERLMQSIPTIDEDPDTFFQRLDAVENGIRLAMAREMYALSHPDKVDPSLSVPEGGSLRIGEDGVVTTVDADGNPVAGNTDLPAYGIPLNDMPAIVESWAAEQENAIREANPNASDKDVAQLVDHLVAQQFGSWPKDLIAE